MTDKQTADTDKAAREAAAKDEQKQSQKQGKTPEPDTQESEFVENPRYGVKVSDEDN